MPAPPPSGRGTSSPASTASSGCSASGGMGVVVAARHEQLEQRVAIKFVRDEALGNEDAVARFLREARAAVKLKSEHVARVLDVGTLESGAPYMVMEYLEGERPRRGARRARAAARRGRGRRTSCRPARPSPRRTPRASSTATSSRRTCSSRARSAAAPRIKVLDFGISKTLGGRAAARRRPHADALDARLAALHVARADALLAGRRRARGHLGARRRALRAAHRRWPFEAETMPELVPQGGDRAAAVARRAPARRPRRRWSTSSSGAWGRTRERFANAAELASPSSRSRRPPRASWPSARAWPWGSARALLDAAGDRDAVPQAQSSSCRSTRCVAARWWTPASTAPWPQTPGSWRARRRERGRRPRPRPGPARSRACCSPAGGPAVAGAMRGRPGSPMRGPGLLARGGCEPLGGSETFGRPRSGLRRPPSPAPEPVAGGDAVAPRRAPRPAKRGPSPAGTRASQAQPKAAPPPRPSTGKTAPTDEDIPKMR